MRLLLAALTIALLPAAAAQSGEAFVEQAGLGDGVTTQEVVDSGLLADESLERALVGVAPTVNVVSVVQEGAENEVGLGQEGVGNRFGLVVIGSGNKIELLQQGQDNVFVGDILGDDNILGGNDTFSESAQIGVGNSYTLFLEGVSETEHSLIQLGDGNVASQIVGPGMIPASIEQSGGAEIAIVRR